MPLFMKRFFKNIKSDKILFFGFLAALIFIILNLSLVGFFYSQLPPFIPLFNQMPWGEARLGLKEEIFIPVAITFTIFVINLIVSSWLYNKTPLISRIFSITTLLISFFTLLFIIRTVRIMV